MKDIKCPSCGKTFRIDPSSFEEILLQIRDEDFNKQILNGSYINPDSLSILILFANSISAEDTGRSKVL